MPSPLHNGPRFGSVWSNLPNPISLRATQSVKDIAHNAGGSHSLRETARVRSLVNPLAGRLHLHLILKARIRAIDARHGSKISPFDLPSTVSAHGPTSTSHLVPHIVPKARPLVDNFSRMHDYLRISLTERCNLRCRSRPSS